MYDIHYSLTEALENYHHLISDYSVFLYIFLAISVFGILIWINRKDKISFYFTLGAALLLIVMTFYFRRLELFNYIDTLFSGNFYKNLYFFHWNMIFCFIFMHVGLSSKKLTDFTKAIVIVFYVLLATNVTFQLYMSNVVGNSRLMVLGNTGAMIIVGNLISFLLYIYLFVYFVVSSVKKKES